MVYDLRIIRRIVISNPNGSLIIDEMCHIHLKMFAMSTRRERGPGPARGWGPKCNRNDAFRGHRVRLMVEKLKEMRRVEETGRYKWYQEYIWVCYRKTIPNVTPWNYNRAIVRATYLFGVSSTSTSLQKSYPPSYLFLFPSIRHFCPFHYFIFTAIHGN